MSDSINSLSDAQLLDVAIQCHDAMAANPGDYPGVDPAAVTQLKDDYNIYDTDLTGHVAKQAAALAQTQVKDGSRGTVRQGLRSLRAVAKANGASAAAMAALGIPAGSTHTATTATRPIGRVDTSQRLIHTISWSDISTPDNKRRPRGAMGAEIWAKYDGPPPVDETECVFVTLSATSPYVKTYSGTDGGKTAHYLIRWRMTDGSVSSWAETVSATITA